MTIIDEMTVDFAIFLLFVCILVNIIRIIKNRIKNMKIRSWFCKHIWKLQSSESLEVYSTVRIIAGYIQNKEKKERCANHYVCIKCGKTTIQEQEYLLEQK